MSKVYLDVTEFIGTISVGIEDTEIILAGTIINPMSIREKSCEYQRYANDYDIQLIFEDRVPELDFYTVPLVDIIAEDSEGGFIGSLGQQFDLEGDAPICYISRDLECFIVSSNAADFLENAESWKNNLMTYDKVKFYPSRAEAKSELEFVEFPKFT